MLTEEIVLITALAAFAVNLFTLIGFYVKMVLLFANAKSEIVERLATLEAHIGPALRKKSKRVCT